MIRFEKFERLKEKFEDKGKLESFYWLVLPPPAFEYGKTIGSYEEQLSFYKEAVNKVYGENWDEINTWIDYQKHR